MNKLLVMCKSRGRPDRIKEMLHSFEETITSDTTLCVCLDEDDPRLHEYDILGHLKEVGQRRTITEAYNFLSSRYNCFDYYGEVNDDMIFRTHGWDTMLISDIEGKGGGWGVAFGDDKVFSGKIMLPTQSVVSANIVFTLGYFSSPNLIHSYTDDSRRDIAQGIDRLFYNPNVVIEHLHPCSGKAQRDANYDWVDSHRQRDEEVYKKWKSEELPIS